MFRRFQRAVVGSLIVALLSGVASFPAATLPLHSAGAAGGNVSFVGTWTPNTGVGWTITSQSPSGACTGFSAVAGFKLTDCHVSGNTYSFTVVQVGTSYSSRNTGVITGDTLSGSFTDTNGTTRQYTATRKATDVTLSGAVIGQTCGPTQCSRSGLPGQLVVATGTSATGTTVTKSTASVADGAWAVTVPAGSYTVGPSSDGVTIDGTDFDPPRVHVDATAGDVAKLDFVTCVSSTDTSEVLPGRPRLADLAASPAGSGPGACPPDHIDWKMSGETGDVPTLAGANIYGLLPTSDIYRPLVARLFFTRYGRRFTACSPKTVWKWKVTPLVRGGKVVAKLPDPLVGCDVTVLVNKTGAYRVVANEFAPGKTRPLHTVKQDVDLRDVLLLAMGDSNGSGEGYPPFYFDQCHRGVASYQYQAAHLLEEQAAGHASVTFVSTSCSGARTQHLVDTPYEGIVPGARLRPQITQLAHQLAPPAGGAARAPDALLISIGVNNVAFGPILAYCANYAASKLASDAARAAQTPPLPNDPLPWSYCQQTPVRAPGDGTGGVKEFKLDPKSTKTLGQTVDSLIAALPQRYDDLAAGLSASGLVKPSAVYLNQYPQFWYASATSLCGGPPSSPFPTQTWAWLASAGNKLNAAVSAAAAQRHWHTITVPASAFYDHGYCRFRGSWFVPVTLGAYYNLAGAFHPIARGAHVTAVQALRLLCPLLGDKKRCTSFPTP